MLHASELSVTGNPTSIIDDYVLARIDYRAKRLAILLKLSDEQRDDYAHDMVAEILNAAPRFDSARSQWKTFANRVLDKFVKGIIRAEVNRRQRACDTPIPFDEMPDGFDVAINDAVQGQMTEVARVDIAIDVAEIVSQMPCHLRRICTLLKDFSMAEAAKKLGLNRTATYRLIAEIRQLFIKAGYDFSVSRATKVA
ncbi:MAG: sigma-70 family RNA polymerase sigma factor [Sedimentisphaerales bacterium]|nr:sigma-70 family RNA polymerase sigma factor [Sedimentisphaerales bacterium]